MTEWIGAGRWHSGYSETLSCSGLSLLLHHKPELSRTLQKINKPKHPVQISGCQAMRLAAAGWVRDWSITLSTAAFQCWWGSSSLHSSHSWPGAGFMESYPYLNSPIPTAQAVSYGHFVACVHSREDTGPVTAGIPSVDTFPVLHGSWHCEYHLPGHLGGLRSGDAGMSTGEYTFSEILFAATANIVSSFPWLVASS